MKNIDTNNYSEPSISIIELQLQGNVLENTSGSTGADWPEEEL